MSFEYIVEKENKKKTLAEADSLNIAKRVAKDFETYNDGRKQNLDMSDELIDEIFFNTKTFEKKADKHEKWKCKVRMCKSYMFYQTLKAFIWKNIYSNINSMFDVSGENQDSDNNSNKQKANLVNILEKMKFQKTCDKVIDNALFYGELISFTSWRKKTEQYRRPISFFQTLFKDDITKLPAILQAAAAGKKHYIDERTIYDNPYVIAVNPADFVYDVTQEDNFDECPKIFKSYKVPEDIINNKYYTISKDTAAAIKALVAKDNSEANELSNQSDEDLKDEVVNGNTVEVLEHWGNIKLPDGTLLKNWHAVVVARKYLVRFCENAQINNPFSYGKILEDPDTKRGISPLYCVYDLSRLQDDLMRRTCDMQSLSENPPLLAPTGFFDEEEIKLYPGKIIEYGDNISPEQAFKQLEFNVNVFLNDITFLSDLMAEVSGIFPNMAGADETRAKTATEISTKTQGQMTRLSMLIDVINQEFIVPVVENVAKLAANFKTGVETLYINKNDDNELLQIDDSVRQGEYKYTYSDRSMINDKSNKADMVVQAAERFGQYMPMNVPELFTWYMEQKGVENPERFMQTQPQIPQELQNYLMQQPEVQALMAGYQQAEQQQQGKPLQQPNIPKEPIKNEAFITE